MLNGGVLQRNRIKSHLLLHSGFYQRSSADTHDTLSENTDLSAHGVHRECSPDCLVLIKPRCRRVDG